ncbi:MAG TPA: hypothetical protein VKT73_07485 [Xanthobacteraceae bacterium]|nr:hypothetical protein [Xanthobacteraceae bacterium]
MRVGHCDRLAPFVFPSFARICRFMQMNALKRPDRAHHWRLTGVAAVAAAMIFAIGEPNSAVAGDDDECIDGGRMTISTTVGSIKPTDYGGISHSLAHGVDCEIWGVAADKPSMVPPECRPGRSIQATGTLNSLMGYIAFLQAETISCD